MPVDYLPYQATPTAPDTSQPAKSKLPAKGTLEYAKLALELLLLLIAVPYLLRELWRHPGKVSRQAARKHLGT